jgi:drug/metabolite transporter (DMT)-like permease
MAIWLLKEKVSLQGWIALLIGFFGVLVILRPGTESFEWISGVILLAALCWAFSNVLVKKLSHSDHPKGIVWLSGVLTLPLSLPLAIFFWSEIAWSDMAWLLLLAWLSNQAQFSITRAYSKAPIALLQPFDFCRLIFISLFVYILFGEQPDLWTWVGAIIILSSGVYIIRQTSNEKRRRLLVENLQKL